MIRFFRLLTRAAQNRFRAATGSSSPTEEAALVFQTLQARVLCLTLAVDSHRLYERHTIP